MGKVCHKCGCENHFENVCGRIPYFRGRSKSCWQKQVNELKQQGSTLTSIPDKSVHDNSSKTVPKQVVDIIDVINHSQSSGENIRRPLELDTLSTISQSRFKTDGPSATQIFSNINVNGVIIRGKQDTGAEINVMPLNIYDQLNQKLNGDRYRVPKFPHSSATFNIISGFRILASPKVLQGALGDSACPMQCSQLCPMPANRHLTGLTWFPIVLYYIK